MYRHTPLERLLLVVVLGTILTFSGAPVDAQEERLRIAVFTPTTEGNTYWPQIHAILDAAAEDLGVELFIDSFDVRDRYAKQDRGAEILRSTRGLDGAILSVAVGQTEPLLTVAERLGIPVMIQGPLFESELPNLGLEPRRRFSSWIGVFSEDEYAKGLELGRVLVEQALEGGMTKDDGSIAVVGIGGDPSWFGSALRAEGLLAAVRQRPQADLLQVAPTKWTESEGYDMAKRLLRRYPEATVFWAASDQLAIGASRALRSSGRVIGEDVVVGGLDLSAAGLEHVRDGHMTASCASLLTEYARVLVYLTDYLRGMDFADLEGSAITFPVFTATAGNANRYIALYRAHRRIDYRALSRTLNPRRDSYDFSPTQLRAVMVDSAVR